MEKPRPKQYSIEKLLTNGFQPFTDLEDEELDSLGAAIGRRHLADPISLTSDGFLIDGHQRLKGMLRQGRTRIDASDVHIVEQANLGNALEWSIQLNVRRRHLTVEQKAEKARQLQQEKGWSQGKIADLFGVSRPAVNQWLAKLKDSTPEDDWSEPDTIVGADGKEYPASIDRSDREPKPKITEARHLWSSKGRAFKMLNTLIAVIDVTEKMEELSDQERTILANALDDLMMAIRRLWAMIEAAHGEARGEVSD